MSSTRRAAEPRRPTHRTRERTASDLDGCVRVLAEVHDRDGYPLDWPERPERWLLPPGLLAAWVVELDGRVAGQVCLSRPQAGDAAPARWSRREHAPVANAAVVNRLFVSPLTRGHGLGTELLSRAVGEARERALHPVLDVLESDASATALYERLGWSGLGTVDQRWGPGRTVTVRCYAAPG